MNAAADAATARALADDKNCLTGDLDRGLPHSVGFRTSELGGRGRQRLHLQQGVPGKPGSMEAPWLDNGRLCARMVLWAWMVSWAHLVVVLAEKDPAGACVLLPAAARIDELMDPSSS